MSKTPGQHLSEKHIPPHDRLIVALDLPSVEAAKAHVELLGASVSFYKLGLQLFMAGGYFEFINWLTARGKQVFVDLKFFDVPETVASAVRQLKNYGASFASVHGNDAMLAAAAREKSAVKILAVTVLTSLDQGDMSDLGFKTDIKPLVLSRARRALALGCDGVISSGLEARELRETLGEQILIVNPGIRPGANVTIEEDDQKRKSTVEEAFKRGADYIVVGRPIYTAKDPRAEADRIQETIRKLFGAKP